MQSEKVAGISEEVIEEDESLRSLQRHLEQFSELVLLFILEVIKNRKAKNKHTPYEIGAAGR